MLSLCLCQSENEISCVLVVCTSIFILPYLSPRGDWKSNPCDPFYLLTILPPRFTNVHPREHGIIKSRLNIGDRERSVDLYSSNMCNIVAREMNTNKNTSFTLALPPVTPPPYYWNKENLVSLFSPVTK